jgi:hypothetical protein
MLNIRRKSLKVLRAKSTNLTLPRSLHSIQEALALITSNNWYNYRIILSQMDRPADSLYVNSAQNKKLAMRNDYYQQFAHKPHLINNPKYKVNTPFEERQKEYQQKAQEKKQMYILYNF